MKKLIYKTLIISFIIFFSQQAMFGIVSYVKYEGFGLYGFWGGLIYSLILIFWIYILLILIYFKISQKFNRVLSATLVVLLGYILSHSDPLIDGNLEFDFISALAFLILIPILIWLDKNVTLDKSKV